MSTSYKLKIHRISKNRFTVKFYVDDIRMICKNIFPEDKKKIGKPFNVPKGFNKEVNLTKDEFMKYAHAYKLHGSKDLDSVEVKINIPKDIIEASDKQMEIISYLDGGNRISKEQFEEYKNLVDSVYGKYSKLFGYTPNQIENDYIRWYKSTEEYLEELMEKKKTVYENNKKLKELGLN